MKQGFDISQMLQLEADDIRKIPYKYKLGEVEVEVAPLTFGQVIAMMPILSKVAKDDLTKLKTTIDTAKKNSDFDEMPELFAKYGTAIQDIILLCIGEDKKQQLMDATFDDTFYLLTAVLYRLGTENFAKSIIQAERMSLLSRKEIIAFQNSISTHTES